MSRPRGRHFNDLRIRCCQCGRFIDRAFDESCFFGNSNDLEPPDSDLYCKKCFEWNKEQAIKQPELTVSIARGYWHKPSHISIAKSVLRHRKKPEKLPRPKDQVEKLMREAGYK